MRLSGLYRWFAIRMLGAVVGIGVFSAAASAQSLEERVSGADSVVVATARAVTAAWRENEHGDRLIVSRVLLEVDETIRTAIHNRESEQKLRERALAIGFKPLSEDGRRWVKSGVTTEEELLRVTRER